MPVLTRLIPSPLVVDIRPGALDDLACVLADERISHSGRLAVAVSGGSGARLRERISPSMPGATWYEVGGGTLDDAVRLASDIKAGHYDAVVGLGGGKIIDCAKFAAARVGLPLVAVPTNLAHDGLCSPVATLDNDAGRGSYGVPNPIAVVIDLDVIREAPVRFVRAGIGDAVSNISAIADWELANRVKGERIDGLAAAMARQAGEAVLRHPGGIGDNDFLQVLAEALVLSGIAMSVSGDSRPSLRGVPRDQPRLRPALPQAGRRPRRAVRSRRGLRDVAARGARTVGVHGRGTAPARAARAAGRDRLHDGRVRQGRRVRPGDPARPLHHPRTPRPEHRTDQGHLHRLCQGHR
ncbi:hypothetical protein SAFG77S_00065 [Streptomyces afghaniensis]